MGGEIESTKRKAVGILCKRAIVLAVAVGILGPRHAAGTMVQFHTDGSIEEGDEYTVVEVFNDATVDMSGGLVETRLWINDHGTFNLFRGILDSVDIIVGDRGALNLWNGLAKDLGGYSFHLARIWSGQGATINIYGYGFERQQDNLYGYWSDGTPFWLYLRDEQTWANTTLHVIPEPGTLLLVAAGGLALIRRKL